MAISDISNLASSAVSTTVNTNQNSQQTGRADLQGQSASAGESSQNDQTAVATTQSVGATDTPPPSTATSFRGSLVDITV
ncbi:MAG: hypothetical protein JKY20_07400 [Alphaproteobacteria bacterium]|nr:hypothetical protein [Alphaproteobacteria bacterium]